MQNGASAGKELEARKYQTVCLPKIGVELELSLFVMCR